MAAIGDRGYRWQIRNGRYEIAGLQIWTGDRWEAYYGPLRSVDSAPGIVKAYLDRQSDFYRPKLA